MTGHAVGDLVGRAMHEVLHHSHADGQCYPREECPIYAAFRDGKIHHAEEVFWRKDGSSFPIEYTSTPLIQGGAVVGAVVVFRDLSHRQNLRERLRRVLELLDLAEPDVVDLGPERWLPRGESAAWQATMNLVRRVAPVDTSVLLLGESGTGKELVARALHDLSPRAGRPLVRLNCGAIPATLIESELFGHERGAFTGATAQRIGRFEQAGEGTLFLDEVAELSLEAQTKLLRVLQEREFERVGGTRTLVSRARIVAATNRDLGAMVAAGSFRADLHYRLNVFPIQLPPLRDRREDVPLLAQHFLHKLATRLGRPLRGFSPEAERRLLAHHWPGNVRELENIVERAALLADGPVLEVPLLGAADARPSQRRMSRPAPAPALIARSTAAPASASYWPPCRPRPGKSPARAARPRRWACTPTRFATACAGWPFSAPRRPDTPAGFVHKPWCTRNRRWRHSNAPCARKPARTLASRSTAGRRHAGTPAAVPVARRVTMSNDARASDRDRCEPATPEQIMEGAITKAITHVVADALAPRLGGGAAGRRRALQLLGGGTLLGALHEVLPLARAHAAAKEETEAAARGLAKDSTGKPLEKTALKVGFVPITCATPIIMAHPMGYYKKYGLDVELVKTAGWAVARDKSLNREYDASHMLTPMPLAITLGVGSNPVPYTMPAVENLNGQAITLSLAHKDKRDPKQWKGMKFAVPFEYSMHNFLLRYYVAEHGLDPDKDIQIRLLPPPEMVANLRAGNVDGFLAPDPFNQRAVFERSASSTCCRRRSGTATRAAPSPPARTSPPRCPTPSGPCSAPWSTRPTTPRQVPPQGDRHRHRAGQLPEPAGHRGRAGVDRSLCRWPGQHQRRA